MKLKKILSLFTASALALGTLASCGVKDDADAASESKDSKNYKIGIVQIMEHMSLNTIRDAVVDRLGDWAIRTEIIVQLIFSRLMVKQQQFSRFLISLRMTALMLLLQLQHRVHSLRRHFLRKFLLYFQQLLIR